MAQAVGGIHLPSLERLGLGKICPFKGHDPSIQPVGAYGRLTEISRGKDSTTGHWELMGLVTSQPFPTYPQGFPPEVVDRFQKAIGTRILGNVAASGTEIIKQLGDEHVRTGYPIVYTSVDSVFQIAAHEDIIPLQRLYEICRTARQILQGPHAVGRVIARPFIGGPGRWQRTSGRKDFSLEPPQATVLDTVKEQNIPVTGIGKVIDLFAGRGFTHQVSGQGNADVMDKIEMVLHQQNEGLILANLVDFDMIYGHRNDPEGYAGALRCFDDFLHGILSSLRSDDMMMITADHGCDPTTPSTDHSREYTPILAYVPGMREGIDLGIRASLADVAQTIAQIFHISELSHGQSFLKEIQNTMDRGSTRQRQEGVKK
jgi:phosphopentomutase